MSFSTLSTNNTSVTMTFVNMTEESESDTNLNRGWIIYSGGIISGVVLLELALVLLMVICRKYQIRRKERIEQEHVYHVRRGERRSNFDFTGKFVSRSSKSKYQNTCVVSEVEPESNIAYNVVIVAPSGPDEAAAYSDHMSPLKEDKMREKKQATDLEAQLKHKEHPKIIVEEPVLVGPNCSYEPSPLATDRSTRATSNLSTPRQLSLGASDGNTNGPRTGTHDGEMIPLQKPSKKTGVMGTSLSVDQLQVDQESDQMEQAYEVLDEIEKQIHILSQSIPMLDVYGNEIVKPPAPKISRSIPTLLDIAGYEDVDTVRQNQAQALPKTKRKPATEQLGVDMAGYEDLDAARPKHKRKQTREQSHVHVHVDTGADFYADKVVASISKHDRSPSLASTCATESVGKGVEKKQSAVQTVGENKKPEEPVYSVVQKKPKAFSVSDLTEEPPPVPPMTAEALYTAIQKPKKNTTRYYSAIITNETLPQLSARYMCDYQEENAPIKAAMSMEHILKEEASKSGTPSSVQPNQEGDCFMLHAQHPSTDDSTYPRTYMYEDELQTDL